MPAGFGADCIDHRLPFQRSTSILDGEAGMKWLPPEILELPTATHDSDESHETEPSALIAAPAASRVGWIVHLLPFHRSANVAVALSLMLPDMPTAVHARADAHETSTRWLFVAPSGVAVRPSDHRCPFQRSTSIMSKPAFEVNVPTAVQSRCDGHDTPSRIGKIA